MKEALVLTSESRLREILSDAIAELKQAREPGNVSVLEAKDWLTQKECLAYTGISKPTLARWRAEGLIRYSKIGGLLFYRRDHVEALLESNLVRPADCARRRRTDK